MANKRRKFADDGWAIWVDGDDTSTVYINDWLNPKGKSYVDLAIRVRQIMVGKSLNVFVPFAITAEEIEDVSLHYDDTKILQATFSATCLVDYMKNAHTSEVAYNGKTVDIVHISTLDYQIKPLASGTLITIDLAALHPFLDNDEAYLVWRMPHKSLDDIFNNRVDMGNVLARLRALISSPVITEKYGYSIRINESRFLPEKITHIGAFHRQKLKKAVIAISIAEEYELNDTGCYRIRRLEEELYKNYLPKNYSCEDVITYQWNQNRQNNFRGQFNFYYSITRNYVSKVSMFIYILIVLGLGVMCEIAADILYFMVQFL